MAIETLNFDTARNLGINYIPCYNFLNLDKMEAKEFYNKRIKEEPTIGSVQLMEEYAKHIIEINFCDGSPIDFEKITVEQLKSIHGTVTKCVDWVNS